MLRDIRDVFLGSRVITRRMQISQCLFSGTPPRATLVRVLNCVLLSVYSGLNVGDIFRVLKNFLCGTLSCRSPGL